ncbi:tetratricopeptide repeat protein [Brachyspira pulli]|uniref:tetratricopeptide repeat protein n=1 Tax=Brachyspira pulli TaxID=310721 RepID=UPI0030047E93
MVEKEAEQSIKNIKVETQKLIDENNKYIQIANLFNLSREMYNNKDYDFTTKYNSIIKYNLEIIKLYGDIENIKDRNHINNYAVAYYNIGKSKSDLGEQDEAIEYLNKSIKLNPNFSNAYVYRGMAYYQLEKYSEALKDYNKAIDLDENNDYAYVNRGLVKEELRELSEDSISIYDIIQDYNEAIKLKPNDFESYVNRARIKEIIKDYNGAIEDYNKVIGLNHKEPKIYFNRYFNKEILLTNIKDKTSEEYKKYFEDTYNDLDIAYNLADGQLKAMIKEKVISMAILDNEVAKKIL